MKIADNIMILKSMGWMYFCVHGPEINGYCYEAKTIFTTNLYMLN